jgi:hypothetical protein
MRPSRLIWLPLLALLGTAVLANSARAQGGINLSWTDCGTFGLAAKTSACTNNAVVASMVVSAISGHPISQLNGAKAAIVLQTTAANLSSWWHFEPGGCHDGSLSSSFDFTSNVSCVDPWVGTATGSLGYTPAFVQPNRAFIFVQCYTPSPMPVNGDDEFYVARVTLQIDKTNGTGSCAGCLDGACIVLQYVDLLQGSPSVDDYHCNPLTRQHVTYNAGFGVPGGCPFIDGGPPPPCPNPVSAHSSTWGSVKAIYH